MKQLALTHANLKTKLSFPNPELIFYYYYSEAEKCTRVVSNGGAFIVVVESTEQIENQLKEIRK